MTLIGSVRAPDVTHNWGHAGGGVGCHDRGGGRSVMIGGCHETSSRRRAKSELPDMVSL
jgi:hypothetical protein